MVGLFRPEEKIGTAVSKVWRDGVPATKHLKAKLSRREKKKQRMNWNFSGLDQNMKTSHHKLKWFPCADNCFLYGSITVMLEDYTGVKLKATSVKI